VRDIKSNICRNGTFNNEIKRFLCQTRGFIGRQFLETYYHHSQDDIQVDETLAKIQIQNL
jgi:hypothetical protein